MASADSDGFRPLLVLVPTLATFGTSVAIGISSPTTAWPAPFVLSVGATTRVAATGCGVVIGEERLEDKLLSSSDSKGPAELLVLELSEARDSPSFKEAGDALPIYESLLLRNLFCFGSSSSISISLAETSAVSTVSADGAGGAIILLRSGFLGPMRFCFGGSFGWTG